MKVAYVTSGLTGIGRLVKGISVGNALKRAGIDCEFTILSSSENVRPAELAGITHTFIPAEPLSTFTRENFEKSILFRELAALAPDIILIDLLWFSLQNMASSLPGRKLLLLRQVNPSFFKISIPELSFVLDTQCFDEIIETEPWGFSFSTIKLNPFTIRNQDEVLSRADASERLGLNRGDRNCLICASGKEGEFEEIMRHRPGLENEGYSVFSSNGLLDGIFPAMDYFRAFDLIVGGAGYNFFWENRRLATNAIFIPFRRQFEDQFWRVSNCKRTKSRHNGADELVKILTQ